MLIAISAEGKELSSRVSEKFESCKCILIINTDTMAVEAIQNPEDPHGISLAKQIVHRDCEVVITGELCSEAFELLAGACVTRYNGYGHTAKNAIDLMNKRLLPLIRNIDGCDDCGGSHHGHQHR